jgi:sodium pump decarboxylase gamma subunit
VLEQLQAGVTVTLMGMGVVFVLLTLLVYVVHGMSKLCRMIEGAAPATTTGGAPAVEEEIVSAIGAAVSTYRRRHKN